MKARRNLKSHGPNKALVMYTKSQEKCQTFATDAKELISNKMMAITRLSYAIRTGLMTHAFGGIGGKHNLMMLSTNFKR